MVGVLELILGVDAALDPDVPPFARGGQLQRLRDADAGRRREQAAHAVARPERSQHHAAQDEGKHTRGGEEEGSHGPDDIRWAVRGGPCPEGARGCVVSRQPPGMEGPEGTYSRRGR